MSGLWGVIIRTHPVIRAAVVGGFAYLAIEMFKPGFAFANLGDGQYIPRSFREDTIVNEDEDSIVKGTNLPWWGLPVLLFGFFSLFV